MTNTHQLKYDVHALEIDEKLIEIKSSQWVSTLCRCGGLFLSGDSKKITLWWKKKCCSCCESVVLRWTVLTTLYGSKCAWRREKRDAKCYICNNCHTLDWCLCHVLKKIIIKTFEMGERKPLIGSWIFLRLFFNFFVLNHSKEWQNSLRHRLLWISIARMDGTGEL